MDEGEEADFRQDAAERRADDAEPHAGETQEVQADAVPGRVERRYEEQIRARDARVARVVHESPVQPHEELLDDEEDDRRRDVLLQRQELAAVDPAPRRPETRKSEVDEEENAVELEGM